MPDPVSGNNIQGILNQRGHRYGKFTDNAYVAQRIKETIRTAMRGNDRRFDPIHREALDLIAHKIARIVNGDPNYIDSWVDIQGYAELVIQELKREGKE